MNTENMLGKIVKGSMTVPADWLGTLVDLFEKLNSSRGAKLMCGLRSLLRGEMTLIKHIIDCDVQPFIPKGWRIDEHRKGGQLEWSSAKILLYTPEVQEVEYIFGNALRKELTGKRVLNACVLDYLLDNPHLIPEEWKNKRVFFWGTVYLDCNRYSCVRYLFCNDLGEWNWDVFWLSRALYKNSPAACFQEERN